MEAIPEVPRSMPIFTVKREICGMHVANTTKPTEIRLKDRLKRSRRRLPRSVREPNTRALSA